MTDLPVSPSPADELLARVTDLSQRWLPMLLSRSGVPWSMTRSLRDLELGEGDLRRELTRVRVAAWRSSEIPGANTELARSAVDLITQMERVLDQREVDFNGAERTVQAVNRDLLGLLVGRTEVDDWSDTWWSKLWSRARAAGPTAT